MGEIGEEGREGEREGERQKYEKMTVRERIDGE